MFSNSSPTATEQLNRITIPLLAPITMNIVLIILCAALVVTAVEALQGDEQDIREQWAMYKKKYQKFYPDPAEENYRLNIFAANLHKVDAHNRAYARGETAYALGLNDMTDMTIQEIRSTRLGANNEPTRQLY